MKRTTKRRLGMAGLLVALVSIGAIATSSWISTSLIYAAPLRGCTVGDPRIRELYISVNNGLLVLGIPYDLLTIDGSWNLLMSGNPNPAAFVSYWWPQVRQVSNGFYLDVPLWIPAFMIAIPSFLLWRRNQKLGEGYCNCGYNLTGNVSGVCPECGTKMQSNGDEVTTSAEDSAR